MKQTVFFTFFLFTCSFCFSQEEADTSKTMDEVTVRAFEQNRRLRSTSTSVKIIDFNNGDRYNKTSLVNGFNTIAGVRMEERSPGSYRINIRGSSLRSPFGVRNVKVYWNDIPVTDPGGNTYFNQFAWNNFSSIEIVKGPAGSMYGAGTGGLILLNCFDRWQPGASVEYVTGSHDLHNFFVSARFGRKENKSQLSYAHNQTDGYRVQSHLRRDNFSWVSKSKITERQQIAVSLLVTDMYYQTPGALTLTEFMANPKAARPAAGGFPSAVNAQAAINQANFLSGFTHQYDFTSALTNYTTFYGSLAEIKNPAIRNYEKRIEPSLGGRTVFMLKKKKDQTDPMTIGWQLVAGSEFQHGFFTTTVFKNVNGKPDSLQTDDDITYKANSYFFQGDLRLKEKWFMNAGLSLNRTRVSFTRRTSFPVASQTRTYRNELAPRISIKNNINEDLSWKTTISRGFSPPTIAELLPSTGVISTDLEAEYGWNYEMTVSYALFKRYLRLEATGFYFKLNNALVQRRDLSGADYFINAGDIRQKGLEFAADYFKSFKAGYFADYLQINASYTYNHFRYGNFVRGSTDFSGKTVPSVPANTFSLIADAQFKRGIYSNITYYTASKIFLNDANTAVAGSYNLLGCRFGWRKTYEKKYKLNFYAGADNLLNEQYSLGNDINAAANRFYNAAAERNYYVGVAIQWIKPVAQ